MVSSLKFKIKSSPGRSRGSIVLRHRAGKKIKNIFVIDKWRYLEDIPGCIIAVQVNISNNNGFFAKVVYFNGLVGFILMADGLEVGDFVISRGRFISNLDELVDGNSFILDQLPFGISIFNLENQFLNGGIFLKSAGVFGIFLGLGNLPGFGLIKFASGKLHLIPFKARVTLGISGNKGFNLLNLKKAGVKRLMGFRPKVRGVAMNPVDHPHGGGEGKTSGGRHPVSPWGLLAKGKKTVKIFNKFVIKNLEKIDKIDGQ